MSRRPARFKQADLARAIKGALQAGLPLAFVKILPDGTILLVPGTPDPSLSPLNPWDG